MKNREEMIRDVHRRIDAYASERKIKHARMAKIAVSVTSVCTAAIVSIGLWKGGVFTPASQPLISNRTESTSSEPKQILPSDNNSVDNRIETSRENKISGPTTKGADPEKRNTEEAAVSSSTVKAADDHEAEQISAPSTDTPDSGETDTENNDAPDTQSVPQNDSEETDSEPQTTFPTQQSTTNEPSGNGNGSNDYGGDTLGSVIINGITYLQSFSDNNAYSPEEYLGNGGDFPGFYQGDTSVSFYTAKENSDIVIVVFYDGSQLNLIRS